MRALRWLAVVLFCVSAGAASAMPTRTPASIEDLPAPEVNVVEDRTGRLRAPVYINGMGPFNFIVDTAANRSAISSRLAAQLALPVTGAGEVHAMGGPFTAPMAHVHAMRAGVIENTNVEMPVIEADALGTADGLLGVEDMAGRQLTMDFENERIIIEQARRPVSQSDWSTIQARRRFGNLIVAEARIEGVPVRVVIDTGAQSSIANSALRNELVRLGRARTDPATIRTATVGGPIVLDQLMFIPRMRMGGVDVSNVRAAVGDPYVFTLWDLHEEPAILLGMDVLGRARAMVIDYERSRVHFLNPEPGRRPLTR